MDVPTPRPLIPTIPFRWLQNAYRGGFTILESLLMLVLLTVLGITTLAIYRKGPPPAGWFALDDAKSAPQPASLIQNEDSVGKEAPPLSLQPASH